MSDSTLIHATTVAIGGAGVLLRGPSGAGKSDLALRLIDAGARLVADDQTELYRDGDIVRTRAPASIAGLIEVRGIGIMRLDPVAAVPLVLVADLVSPEGLERLPERQIEGILGVSVPIVAVAPFEASAAAKLRLAVRACAAPAVWLGDRAQVWRP